MTKFDCTWVRRVADKDLYAPFNVAKDCDYYSDLQCKFKRLYDVCGLAGADSKSLAIVEECSKDVLEALVRIYEGDICSGYELIAKQVELCSGDPLAFASLGGSAIFSGSAETELQLFRARLGDPKGFKACDMLHLPLSKRGMSGSYRFSIPGLPSLYLSNSSFGCWIELGQPAEREFNVSPVLIAEDLKVFNLAVMGRDITLLNEPNDVRVYTWLRLLILMIATSYKIREPNRFFKSEYLVSQGIMLACKKLGLDGVAYYSKRVTDEIFARVAINLALFADYKNGNEYGSVCGRLKVDDSFNYMLFKQLGPFPEYDGYELRSLKTGFITNVGAYARQRSYAATEFCSFDRYLFGAWENKDQLAFGNALPLSL